MQSLATSSLANHVKTTGHHVDFDKPITISNKYVLCTYCEVHQLMFFFLPNLSQPMLRNTEQIKIKMMF